MTDAPHILVVDDDRRLRGLVQRYLGGEGFAVATASDAETARTMLTSLRFDLAVVDIMMPGEDGLSLTADLCADSGAAARVPVLLLTARGAPEDRIEGLECGADDYLAKPFEPRELLLRINAILRRAQAPAAAEPSRPYRFGAWRFDAGRGELTGPEGPVRLSDSQARLMARLAEASGAPVDREALAESGGSARSVDVHVARLRRKIEADPASPVHLCTVRGRGYALRVE